MLVIYDCVDDVSDIDVNANSTYPPPGPLLQVPTVDCHACELTTKAVDRVVIMDFWRSILVVCVFLACASEAILQPSRPLIVVIGEPSDPDLDISPLLRSIEVANDHYRAKHPLSDARYLPPAVVFNPQLGTNELLHNYTQAIQKHCPAVYALLQALTSQSPASWSLSSPYWTVSLAGGAGAPDSAQTLLPALPHTLVAACASTLYSRNIHSPFATIPTAHGSSTPLAPVLLLLHATPAMYEVDPTPPHAADADPSAGPLVSADAWPYTVTPPLFDPVLGPELQRRLWGHDDDTACHNSKAVAPGTDSARHGEDSWPVHVWGHPEPFPWLGVLPGNSPDDSTSENDSEASDGHFPSALYHWPVSPATLLRPYSGLPHVWLCACHAVEVEQDARQWLRGEALDGGLTLSSDASGAAAAAGSRDAVLGESGVCAAQASVRPLDATAADMLRQRDVCAWRSTEAIGERVSGACDGLVGLSHGEVRLLHQKRSGSDVAGSMIGGISAPVYKPLVSALALLAAGADEEEIRQARDGCGGQGEEQSSGVGGQCNGLDDMYEEIVADIARVQQMPRGIGSVDDVNEDVSVDVDDEPVDHEVNEGFGDLFDADDDADDDFDMFGDDVDLSSLRASLESIET